MCFKSPNHAQLRAFKRVDKNTIHEEYVKALRCFRRIFGFLKLLFLNELYTYWLTISVNILSIGMMAFGGSMLVLAYGQV